MPRVVATLTTGLVLTLAMSSCGEPVSAKDAGDRGASVEFGASKEEYIEALSEIEPITLTFQSPASSDAEGSYLGQRDVEFAEMIDDWSGGKVTINVVWNGTVANPSEVDDALADGRLDLATFTYVIDPQEYPVSNAISSSIIEIPVSPVVGELVADAAVVEAAWSTPEYLSEVEEAGMVPIIPFVPGGYSGIVCGQQTTHPNDFEGQQVRASMTAQNEQLVSLGANPISLDFSELYEGIERGLINCSTSALTTASGGGIIGAAPHITMPTEAPLAVGPQGFMAGSTFESLPLAVQQLIYDRSADWYQFNNHATRVYAKDAVDEAEENGGGLSVLDEESNAILAEVNDEIITEIEASETFDGATYMDTFRTSIEQWTEKIEGLGYSDSGDYTDYVEWYEGDLSSVDNSDYLSPFYDLYAEEVLAGNRP